MFYPSLDIRLLQHVAGSVVGSPVGRWEDGEALLEDFIGWLAARGRSSYTQRSYRLGAAHFLRWVEAQGIEPDAMGRAEAIAYVGEFRRGEPGGEGRAPRTVNHRVSVLSTLFEFWAEREPERWADREPPVPPAPSAMAGSHGVPGRDAPRRGRPGELRTRTPRTMPRRIEPEVAAALIEAARSWRDKALLTLLWRSGQRIGDWSERHGRHGLLGLALGDLDRRSGSIVVRLKGARDQHRVPVAEDFWPLFARYVREERGLGEPGEAAWIALRKGRGRPLSYPTFESQLRALSARVGVSVSAHMFRHALAQALVDVAGLKVAQEVLGHAHLSTTAASYARVDEAAMVSALARANDLASLAARQAQPAASDEEPEAPGRFVFAYDAETARELEQAAGGDEQAGSR